MTKNFRGGETNIDCINLTVPYERDMIIPAIESGIMLVTESEPKIIEAHQIAIAAAFRRHQNESELEAEKRLALENLIVDKVIMSASPAELIDGIRALRSQA